MSLSVSTSDGTDYSRIVSVGEKTGDEAPARMDFTVTSSRAHERKKTEYVVTAYRCVYLQGTKCWQNAR